MEPKSFESELSYQRFICKGAIRRGRDRMLEVLPRMSERANELLENLQKHGDAETPMNTNDLYRWFQTYTDALREANLEWYEASQMLKVLDSLETAQKAEQKKLFQR
jgi:hypothetical protein